MSSRSLVVDQSSRSIAFRGAVAAVLSLVLLGLVPGGGAASSAPEFEAEPSGVAEVSSSLDPLVYQGLVEVAESEGGVGVIVELAVPFVPEGRLGTAGVLRQRRANTAAIDTFLSKIGGGGVEVIHRFDTFAGVSLQLDEGASARLVELDHLIGNVAEDVPLEPMLQDAPALMDAPAVWDAGYTGAGSAVAIIDSGVDPEDADLGDGQGGDRLVAEACFSPECPNGETEMIGDGAAAPLPQEFKKAEHGSLMAALVAGSTGTPGVAPAASVVAVRVVSPSEECGPEDDPYPCVVVSQSGVIAGLDWLVDQVDELDISVVNLSVGAGSYGSECPDSVYAAPIQHLHSLGVAVIAATGNDGHKDGISEPACVPEAVAVGVAKGDTHEELEVSNHSNSSDSVDLIAPSHGLLIGTSSATANVSGALALLADAFPDAMPIEIAEVLRATGIDIEDVNGITRPFPNLSAAYKLLERIYGRVCVPDPSAGVPCDLPEPAPDDVPPETCPQGFTIVHVDPQYPVTLGTGCDDFIIGTEGPDTIDGRGGDDFILGLGGDDWITGWAGDDNIHGGDGDDSLYGEWGRDRIFGDAGVDVVDAGDNNDEVSGGDGDDLINGGWGADEIHGNAGDDEIDGGHGGGDEIFGGDGDDMLYGGTDLGSDMLYGGDGNDAIVGQAGNDHLEGNRGADVVWGSSGTDTVQLVDDLNGSELPVSEDGSDMAWGGADEDFVWFHLTDQFFDFEHEYPA